MNHTEQAVRSGQVFTPEYFQAVRRDAQGEPKTDPSIDYPAPEHTSRDPWPDGLEIPGPVQSFKGLGEGNGWAVRVMYSRGRQPHGTTGRPTAVSGWFGVQMLHPETRARVVATYCQRSASWSTVHLMTRTEITSQASITDAQEFTRLAGRVLNLRTWIASRIAERAAKPRAPRKTSAKTSAKREAGG